MFSLRWYILGKHSDLVFTENNNTEGSLEVNLLNLKDQECLTSQIVIDSQLSSEYQNIVNIEGNVESTKMSVPNCDLLQQFEV